MVLASIFEPAFQQWTSVFVCGVVGDSFPERVAEVLAFQHAQEYTVRVDQLQVAPADGLRAALRQDPDCVVVDDRDMANLEMVLRTALTGHRVICGVGLDAPAAWQQILLNPSHLGLEYALLVDTAAVFQVVREADAPTLCQLARRESDGSWQSVAPVRWPGPPTPVEPEPLRVDSSWPERREPLLESLRRTRRDTLRSGWGPQLDEGVEPSCRDSHMGGPARLKVGESWPACGACGNAMLCVLQVYLSELPESARIALALGDGVLQLFYCTAPDCSQDEPWQPWSASHLVRVCGADELSDAAVEHHQEGYRPVRIAGWAEFQEGPGSEERERDDQAEPGLEFSWLWREWFRRPDQSESHQRVYAEVFEHFQTEPEQFAELNQLTELHYGDKLLGWPAWSQAAEYPICPDCQQPMRYLLQINNDGGDIGPPGHGSALGQVFAGDGNGHVFGCTQHRHQLTFSWACD